MADPPIFKTDAVDWSSIGDQWMWGALRAIAKSSVSADIRKVLLETAGEAKALAWDLLVDLALRAGEGYHSLQEIGLPFIAAFTAPIVQGLFGADVNEEQFKRILARGSGAPAAQSIVKGLMEAISGGPGARSLEPGDAGARRIASAAVQAALESSWNALIPELISSVMPEIGHFETIHELPESIIRSLGVSRLVRRALSPLIDATCATPMRWQVNKDYRPEGLTTALTVRQFLRGKLTREQLDESLARQGYAPEKIEALIHDASQRFSDGELKAMVAFNVIDDTLAVERLKDNGWPESQADAFVKSWRVERAFAYQDREASAIAAAFIRNDIDQPDFSARIDRLIPNEDLRASFKAYAEHAQAVNVKHLSHAEIKECVVRGILNPIDYRAWLKREGYAADDAIALELLLTLEIRGTVEAAKEKQRVADERAAAKAAADADRAARAAELAAKQARTPASLDDLKRAVVRGILPIDAYAARLVELHYAADDRAFLVELLQEQRDDFLAAEEKRAHAGDGSPDKALTIAQAERAVLAGVITLATYRDRLVGQGFPVEDAALLVASLDRDMRDAADAAQRRAVVNAQAKVRGVSLAELERAVKLDVRTLDDYAAKLIALHVSSDDQVTLMGILRAELAQADAARAKRAAAPPTPEGPDVTRAQMAQAVLDGLASIDDYAAYLTALGYAADDVDLLVNLLLVELQDARQATGG